MILDTPFSVEGSPVENRETRWLSCNTSKPMSTRGSSSRYFYSLRLKKEKLNESDRASLCETNFTTGALSRACNDTDLCEDACPSIFSTNTQMLASISSHNNVSIGSLMALTSGNYLKLAATIINLELITLFYKLNWRTCSFLRLLDL